ncbi:MAG: GNAT family N-acetyltransferase [Acidobacteria bacterium]|nr:GNAT family N-acetyltransferase [Acidobacteriota bacterium]
MKQREYGRGGADAQGQRGDGDGKKRGLPPDRAKCVQEIAGHMEYSDVKTGASVSMDFVKGTNREAVRSRLDSDAAWAAYAIGDLGPAMAPHCEWFVDGGEIALILSAFGSPVVWALGGSFAGALETLRTADRISVTMRESARDELSRYFHTGNLQSMWRMRLDIGAFRSLPLTGVERLGPADVPAVEALYRDGDAHHEAPDFFFEAMIANGIYYGVREEGELIAVAGTHLAVDSEGVAAIGNVYTRRDRRCRGLAARTTSAVASEALDRGMPLVVLNVRRENATARRVYERLGFQVHCAFLEGAVERRP